jgi:ribose transport system substrate-binding protein
MTERNGTFNRAGFIGLGSALGALTAAGGSLLGPANVALAAGGGRPLTDLKFLFIVKTVNSDYWQTCIAGGKAAQEQLGLKGLQFTGANSEANIQGQIALVEDALAKKPDFLVLAPTSANALDATIDKVYKAGIKVILIDSSANTDSFDAFLATDNHAGGVLAAKTLAEAIKKKTGAAAGQVAYVTFLSGVGSLTLRDQGFLDGIKAYPQISVVGHQDAGGDQSQKPIGVVADLLTRFPRLAGVFADNLYTLEGAATAFRENHADPKKISLVGFDPSTKLVAGLKAGTVDGIILQDPYQMGFGGVMYGIVAAAGINVPKFLNTGVTAATPDNANSTLTQALLNPMKERHFGFGTA